MTDKNNLDARLEHLLRLFSKPSDEQVRNSQQRIRERLQSGTAETVDSRTFSTRMVSPSNGRRRLALFAATAILASFAAGIVMLRSPVSAVVKAADGSLYRVKGEEREMLHSSDEIRAGEVIHAAAGDGAILEMKDGSHVEIRSQSELVLENASDGMRIQLKLGGVIVDAAAQHRGHLYVMTKDITVSVLDTVFLVNTQDEGSIVAVIEGEVHVQQGATEKKLRPGQQVATSPKLESRPVSQEIAWSRNAEEHVARLQETTVGPLEQTAKTGSSEPALAFGAVSIRPVLPGTSRTVGFVCEGVDGTRRTYEGTEGGPTAPVAVQGRCVGTIYMWPSWSGLLTASRKRRRSVRSGQCLAGERCRVRLRNPCLKEVSARATRSRQWPMIHRP